MNVPKVSHMVSGLTRVYSIHSPVPPTAPANASVWSDVSSPRGKGLARVRAMTASILCSTRQFTAAAAPATSQMPMVAASRSFGGTMPGMDRNMPITAQNTIKDTTRGLVRLRNSRRRKRAAVEASCMGKFYHARLATLADARCPEQPREVFRHPLGIEIARESQHQVAERIQEVDVIGRAPRRREFRKKRSAGRARDAQALVVAQVCRIGERGIGEEPHSLDSLGVLALCEAHLAHVKEFFSAAFGAGAGIDLQQHPSAAQLRESERAAVQAPQFGVGDGAGFDQLAVVQPRLRLPYEVGEPGRDGGRGAKRKDDKRDAPAATPVLSRVRNRLA